VRRFWAIIVAGFLTLSAGTAGAEAIPIPDPDKYSADVMEALAKKGAHDAAVAIVETIGKTDALNGLQSALQILGGKEFAFTEKVIDKRYANALRQIVYYAYLKGVGFVYFRFNFKMTDKGWILANFAFKDETNDLFPKDFIER
jgi:hypothetical protein